MASKTQKVITPENLGQGIAYNPQTKKWEVHFVSEAEIEQVSNYVEPQEDDEHYVAKECVKLRDRTTGYMWDSCKSTLKDRAPARDEEATINAEIVVSSGAPYIRVFDVTSNIDGTGVAGNYEYEQDLSRFSTTKEYNDFIKDKKIKLVTTKRFAETLEGKPMIRSTTLEASYPVMQDRAEERTWSFTSADGYLDVYSGDQDHWDEVYRSGKLTIKLITQESGKQPVETDITSSFDLYTSPNRIAYENNGISDPSTANIKIQFVPSTVVVEKLGYKTTANFVNFDNGWVPKPRRAPILSDLRDIRWEPGLSNGDISWRLNGGSEFSLLSNRAYDFFAYRKTFDGAHFEDAKAMNEHYRGTEIDLEFTEVETPTETITDGTVKAPWIDLPYLDTAVTLKYSGSTDTSAAGFGIHPGWSHTEYTTTGTLNEFELKAVKNGLHAYDLNVHANVTISDLDGSNAHTFTMENASFDTWATLGTESDYFEFIKPYERSGKQFKVKFEVTPLDVKWWNGKIRANFESKEFTITPNN